MAASRSACAHKTFAGEVLQAVQRTGAWPCGRSSSTRSSTGSCSTAASRRSPGRRWRKSAKSAAGPAVCWRPRRTATTAPASSRRPPRRPQLGKEGRDERPPSRHSSPCGRSWRSRSPTSLFLWRRDRRAEGRPAPGDGLGRAGARLEQHLDAADRQPHRHALDRRAHADRRQGVRPRPGDHRPRVQGDRAGAQADRRRPRRDRRADHGQGLSGDRDRPREGGALRRQRRRHPGHDRGGPGRPDHHADGRGPRPLPGARPLRARLTARTRKRSSVCWSAAAPWRRGRRHGDGGYGRADLDGPDGRPARHRRRNTRPAPGRCKSRSPRWPTCASSKGRR